MREWNGRYWDDQRGGLPDCAGKGGVVVDVVDHRDSIGLGVYRREEGEETVNTRKHMHNKIIGGARGVLMQR